LALDFGGDSSHGDIVTSGGPFSGPVSSWGEEKPK
jgi:hypothetical protein